MAATLAECLGITVEELAEREHQRMKFQPVPKGMEPTDIVCRHCGEHIARYYLKVRGSFAVATQLEQYHMKQHTERKAA